MFNRYLAGAGDEGLDGLRLLSLFQSVRAAIRAHVLFMKSEQAGGSDAVWQEPSAISIWRTPHHTPGRRCWWRSAACRGPENRCSHAGLPA